MTTLKPLRKKEKNFKAPAIFLNPHTKTDGRIIREANYDYPNKPDKDGIRSIDALFVDAKDWKEVSEGAQFQMGSLKEAYGIKGSRSIRDRILIIEAGLEFALRGNDEDRQKMLKTQFVDPKLIETVNAISGQEHLASTQKLDRTIAEAYPLIDARTIRDFMEFALDKKTDILVRPTVPITSVRNIEKQSHKYRSMIRDFKVLLSTTFNKYEGNIDEMNLLTVNASVIEPENYGRLAELALADSPDQIGIRLMNIDPKNESRLRYILDFLTEIRQAMLINNIQRPLHVVNVDAFGFVTFCFGASSITMPLGSDPYYYSRGHDPVNPPAHEGSFYVIQKRQHVLYKRLRLDTINAEPPFRLPCYCEACGDYETITKVESLRRWNDYRKLHEALARDIEVTELRSVPSSLFAESVKDMLARSTTSYAAYVPNKPIVDF